MTVGGRVRVLVVDDSAFARKVLREALGSHPDIDVVGIARDGLEALESIAELKPDVVTLDLMMPNLDGIGVLKAIHRTGGPRIVVVSISGADTMLGIEALQLGAVAVVRKPTALATDQLYQLSEQLTAKVREAAIAVNRSGPAPGVDTSSLVHQADRGHFAVVVVGTSTGGPQALTRLLTVLPADLSVPMAVALHIPVGYTETLARRLDGACALAVVEAAEGLELPAGMVAVARGGMQLRLENAAGRVRAHLDTQPITAPHAPSVDVLFKSAAAAFGSRVLGIVLTGMGDDGLEGARAITEAGGVVLTEAESSCVVYGMPRSVKEAGLSAGEASIDAMAALILRHL